MGKILQVLKNVSLTAEAKAGIDALDKRMADLEKYFRDHQAIEQEHGSLKNPPAERPPSQPYDSEQGMGTPPARIVMRKSK